MLWHPLTLASLAGLAAAAPTMLRFGCSQIVIDRIDPLVNPGQLPSPHLHQVVGGNAFNVSMPSQDISQLASCTTCSYSDDLSNYWTANMYFRARNGSYKRVPQIPNRELFQDKFTAQTKGGLDTEAFPTGPCSGIRSNILYPTCWDGKNLDSPDHKSHVAYPTSGPALFTGSSVGSACPSTHPVKIPQIMLEIVWDTTQFNNKADWPADGSQPFVLSTGDNTGYGQHGDYVFGWKGDSLQKLMDDNKNCMGSACGGLKAQDAGKANACRVSGKVREEWEGWLDKLPGMEGMPM
ncbi:hypothetical protein SMACR_07610 [Sordaria macrospora]|uniref:WGS project CABT00000000 data, contig 2.27 n=2 Tax=Sordaria macrospora TaxID=5147 RepID=F7W4D0_SORMK|nr:uncharacterized protein SMAC_07610 [Sordaria macrospora k-hell]KAA8634907.1 hypothetical protein SMACR_07610 [Sordaria macrospora]CCC14883.1 unnamed protein product [Sordaria macrospora k-hell]